MYFKNNDFNIIIWIDSSKNILDKLDLLNQYLKKNELNPIFISRSNNISNLLRLRNLKALSILQISGLILREINLKDILNLTKVRNKNFENEMYWDNIQKKLLNKRLKFSFRHFYNYFIDLILKKIFSISINFLINKGNLKKIIILNGLNSFGYILTKICHKNNIPFMFWENGLYSNTLFINPFGVNAYGRKCLTLLNSKPYRIININQFANEFIKTQAKNILCPLQFDIDTNIVCSSQFKNCNQFLNNIIFPLSQILRNHNFVIRPHPKQKKIKNRIKNFIKNSKNLKVDNIQDIDNSLENIDLVICINSTVGFTAFTKGLPVISFGRSFWNDIYSGNILNINKNNFEFFYNNHKSIYSKDIISEIEKCSLGYNSFDSNIIDCNHESFIQYKPSIFFPKKII